MGSAGLDYALKLDQMAKKEGWNLTTPGEQSAAKCDQFDKMIADAKAGHVNHVIVFEPQALGDDYQELIRNLNKLAEAELTLVIVPPSDRGKKV